MKGMSIKRFSRELGIPVKKLIVQLNEAGVKVSNGSDTINNQHKLKFLKFLQARKNRPVADPAKSIDKEIPEKKEEPLQVAGVLLDELKGFDGLKELDGLLTGLMAKQKVQALIKDDGLERVVDLIFYLVKSAGSEAQLPAAAMLGRLAAVARSRGDVVYERVSNLFTQEPEPIESLEDGDAKAYAASIITHIDASWTRDYGLRQIILIDTADNARKELLSASLKQEGSISNWLNAISEQADQLKSIANPNSRLKRVRRLSRAMSETAQAWRGEVGKDAGDSLAGSIRALIKGKREELDQEVLVEAVDNLLSILVRIIELRFSTALYPETYAALEQGKRVLGPGLWRNILNESEIIVDLRMALLEAGLVLARQNKTDKGIMAVMAASWGSRPQITAAIKRHFAEAMDLSVEVADWWRSAGEIAESVAEVKHEIKNEEDVQIGSLLIEVERNKEPIKKVQKAIVPYLAMADTRYAETLKEALNGCLTTSQIVRRLARMRKLTMQDEEATIIEYNSMEHEMLGGHQSGVRKVKIMRNGVKTSFSGQARTIVKPWVEPYTEED